MSSTTPTIINNDVPPKNIAKPSFTPDNFAIAGIIAMIAVKNEQFQTPEAVRRRDYDD